VDATYRRHRSASRLERLLSRLVPARPAQDTVATRIDFARREDIDVEVTQA
jgi:hypothetical protein